MPVESDQRSLMAWAFNLTGLGGAEIEECDGEWDGEQGGLGRAFGDQMSICSIVKLAYICATVDDSYGSLTVIIVLFSFY